MSLADALSNVLSRLHVHTTSQTNQGTAHLIESHLGRLEAVAGDVAKGDAEALKVLGELYGALNAPAPVLAAEAVKAVAAVVEDVAAPHPAEAPVPAAEPAPAAAEVAPAAPVEAQPLATGGVVTGPGPVLVGESGPEFLAPAEPGHAEV